MKVKNLIDCNAIEAHKFFPMISDFNVCEMALDVLQIAEVQMTHKNHRTLLRIEDSISGDRHQMRADVGRIKQVLLNLIQNAMSESTKESTVSIDIYLDEDGKSE